MRMSYFARYKTRRRLLQKKKKEGKKKERLASVPRFSVREKRWERFSTKIRRHGIVRQRNVPEKKEKEDEMQD
ncbi:hypothetical protein F2P81_020385 [Scophthalmus maximus]|uniref:Uncharacterized protein n=1 Tax=Scophthalmus maximus TaxID=52904 RepID=A0A6A4SA85_SCOMX|nr:hypothetical protein F2P81_020385 [Scophthalmus maximus]